MVFELKSRRQSGGRKAAAMIDKLPDF